MVKIHHPSLCHSHLILYSKWPEITLIKVPDLEQYLCIKVISAIKYLQININFNNVIIKLFSFVFQYLNYKLLIINIKIKLLIYCEIYRHVWQQYTQGMYTSKRGVIFSNVSLPTISLSLLSRLWVPIEITLFTIQLRTFLL